jgi:type IV pilus assembly protein PilC
MTTFSYKIIRNGIVEEGTQESENKEALARQFSSEKVTVVRIEVQEKKKGIFSYSFGGVKDIEKISFAKNLSAMVRAGLSVSRGLEVMERQTKNVTFKTILTTLVESVRRGQTLSEGLKVFPKTFPSLFVAMTAAGEESGQLADALKTAAFQMEESNTLKRKVRGAMMYPLIVVSAMISIGILMLIYVVPTLTATFKELAIDLPLSTRAIIVTSDFMSSHTLVFLFILAVGIVGGIFIYRLPRTRRMVEFGVLHMPVIGSLVSQIQTARTARTFSSLLSAGVSVVESLKITRDVIQNSYYKEVLTEAIVEIQKGSTIASVFERYENLYPPVMGEMIAVGEETGSLPAMLLEIAVFYEEEVTQRTKDLSTIIEPILMVVIGAGVGFFAIAMISPTYSLVDGL